MFGINKIKKVFSGAIIILVLAFALLMAGTVYADDGTQPEDPAPAAQQSSTDENTPTAAPDETPAVEETEAVPAEMPAEGSVAEAPTEEAAETIAETPTEADAAMVEEPPEANVENVAEAPAVDSSLLAETADALADQQLTLVDESGATMDLASQESLEAVTGGDPWWIVAGVKYAYVKNISACPSDVLPANCFVHATKPISAALTYMDTNNLVPTDGILHVEAGTYSETAITVDGTAGNGYLANLKGLVSSGTSSDTTLVANVTVSHTLLGFTLSGFTITGGLDIYDNVGVVTLNDLNVTNSSGTGIQVTNHNGAVNVTNVKSDNNLRNGMYVDNTAGTLGVTVTNSEFSNSSSNYYAGLKVTTNGTIVLNGVAANHNHGNGAELNAQKGTTIKNSAFNLNVCSPYNGGNGFGVYIDNASTANNVNFENVQADGNTNNGIYIISHGNVTLKNVNTANNGFGSTPMQGTLIDNRSGTGTVTITNSTFNHNGQDGLKVLSHKNVAMNGITALQNTYNGVEIDNCDFSSTTCLGTGTVSVTGNLPNYFNNNSHEGISILSGGAVTLSNFQADNNSSAGADIRNGYSGRSGAVTLNVTYVPTVGTWTNTISENLSEGLYIYSFGNISLDKCTFVHNSAIGADLDNSSASSARTVTVKNSSFTLNAAAGLNINSTGAVTVNNTDSYQNTTYGLYVGTGGGTTTVSGVGTAKNNYSENGTYGIYVYSGGIISISNALATNNQYGISLSNDSAENKSVTLANVDCSNSSAGEGLLVYSKGAITLTDVVSNGNSLGSGAALYNYGGTTSQPIKITRGQFDNNVSAYGLLVVSNGTLTLSGVQADYNGIMGANIDVCRYNGVLDACQGNGSVIVNGTGNSFSHNQNRGLQFASRNGASLSNVTIDSNEAEGLYITHNHNSCTGTITLSSTGGFMNSFSNNTNEGIYILSYGMVSLANLKTNNNIDVGAYIENSSSPTAKNVSITNAEIKNNQGYGLEILSNGIVTLSGVLVSDSSAHYQEIDDALGQNAHDRLPYDQTYDEVWWFEGSASQSVSIDLVSPDFDAYVELYDSEWRLLSADDDSGGGTDASLTYILPSLQTYYIKVKSAIEGEYGSYTLSMDGSSPYTSYNYYYGVYIMNTSGSGDVIVNNNAGRGYGLDVRDSNNLGANIYTHGNVTLNGVRAFYNGGSYGVAIDNYGTENKSVNLTNCSFNANDVGGLYISSKGSISWNGGGASKNIGDYGANLQNDDAAAARTVTLSNLVCDANQTTGLYVYSLGKITLTNVSASDAYAGSGAILDNCRVSGGVCQGSGDISISGTYGQLEFNRNNYYGLVAYSRGLISLTNVNASGNHIQDGLYLANNYSNAAAGVTVKSTSPLTPSLFSGNWEKGVNISTNGPVILTNLTAKDNSTDSGIYVYNSTFAQPATLSHIKTGGNTGYGLTVNTIGAISLDYAEDSGNTIGGLSLTNRNAITMQPVTVSHARIEGNTTGFGLYILSNGLVTLNNVYSNNNRYGVEISNNYDFTPVVKILSTFGENIFNNNTSQGLIIYSFGDVTLNQVTANWNGYQGVEVSTSSKLIANTVLTYRNGKDGMYISAHNGVSISGLQSYNNGATSNYDGLFIYVISGSPVSILNSFITGNYGDGIEISGNTNPTLTGTCYFGNDINNTGDKNLRVY